ncbi:MAG: radical SAM protein [Bacteroidales bacterium]|jgi:uncharacterized protein|nr:radical SAM protein [Bacteroidales bacterium]
MHFFGAKNENYVFFPDSLRFFEINQSTEAILKDIELNKLSSQEICKKHQISENELTSVYNLLNHSEEIAVKKAEINDRVLNRLVLHISNVCNLSCRYCYAGGGSYSSDEIFMSEEIIQKTLSLFFSHFEKINAIQLFGGEPLLNAEAIKQVGQFVFNIEKEKRPQITVVTNGSVLSEEILGLIKEFDINVTVSLDGPEVINDKLRVFKDGTGTSETVEENIKSIAENTEKQVMIECTYTKLHEQHGIYFYDLAEYFNKSFKSKNIHIVPVINQDDNLSITDYSNIISSAEKIFQNITSGNPLPTLLTKVLNGLGNKHAVPLFCDAGLGTLAVSAEGNVYPCFMFNDIPGFLMGNVNNPLLFDENRFLSHRKKYSSFDKFSAGPCQNCFANTLCTGCLGQNYFETEDIYKPSAKKCELEKLVIELVISELIKLQKKSQSIND